MARGAGGTALDEPPEESRPDRRSAARSDDRPGEDGAVEPDEGASEPPIGRRARREQARKRRFWRVHVPLIAGLLIVAVIVGAIVRAGTDDNGDATAPNRTAAGAKAPETLLLAHRGADGRMDLLTLVGASGKSASILLFPVATQVEVPSLGLQALADLPNQGDHGLLQTTVENLLGVKVSKTLVLDDAGLNGALAPAAPVPVNLHRPVEFEGSDDPLRAAGFFRATPGEAARLLVSRQSGSELDRLVTVQDVLDGWMRRLRDPAVAKATTRAQPGLAGLVAAANASTRRTDTLPVESVTTGGDERFEPRATDLTKYAKAAFPDALLAVGGSRPRVEILNGTGAVGLAQTIASRVVPAGGQVTLTGNVAKFGLPKTQVVYYRDEDRAAAQRMLKALGCGSLQKADTPLGVVDVTILAGADCFRTGAPPAP